MFTLLLWGCIGEFQEKNFIPELEIRSPEESLFQQDERILFTLYAWDPDAGTNGLEVNIQSDLDGLVFSGIPQEDGMLEASLLLSIGSHLITIFATDADAGVKSVTKEIIVNGRPHTPITQLLPATPNTTDVISLRLEEQGDPDGDTINHLIQWFRNGTEQLELQGQNQLDPTLTSKNDTWQVRVTPSDATAQGEASTSSVTIADSLPQVESVTITSSTTPTLTGSQLSCVADAIDADNDALTIQYEWRRIVEEQISEFAIAGDSLTIEATNFNPYDKVLCRATARDSEGNEASSQTWIDIENTTPTITNLSISSQTAIRSGALTNCTATTDDLDMEPLNIAYQWSKNGTQTLGYNQELILDGIDITRHDELHCTLTVTDPHQQSTQETITVPIENSPPEVSSAAITPTFPKTQDTLTCNATSFDMDSDVTGLTFAWRINGVLQSETSSSLQDGFSVNDTVECLITPNDGIENGQQLVVSTTIQNTAPTINTVSFADQSPYTNTILTTLVSSTDLDGDAITLFYNWYVEGTLVKQGLGDSLDGNQYFAAGDQIYVEVTPYDNRDYGTAVTSTVLQVNDAPPTTPVIQVIPATTSPQSSDFVCEVLVLSEDPDVGPVAYNFSWTRNGIPWIGAGAVTTSTTYPGDTIPAAFVENNDTWECSLTVEDTSGLSTAAVPSSGSASCGYNLGLEEICPALSCLEIIENDPSLAGEDGLYYLKPDSQTFEAYCDMSHDGGGWTLLMRTTKSANLSPGPFGYDALAYWESTSLYNETEIFPNAVDPSVVDGIDPYAKYQTFNEVTGESLRLNIAWGTDADFNIVYNDMAGSTALELFSGPSVLIDGNADAGCHGPLLEDSINPIYFSIGQGQQIFGINTEQNYPNIRFGILSNNKENADSYYSSAFGIGVSLSSSLNRSFIWENAGSASCGSYGDSFVGSGNQVADLWIR